jgi:hypothetical protein
MTKTIPDVSDRIAPSDAIALDNSFEMFSRGSSLGWSITAGSSLQNY